MVVVMVDVVATVDEEAMEATEEREKLMLKLMPMLTMDVGATEDMVDMEVMAVTVDMDMDASEDPQNPTMAVVDTEVATEVMVDVVVMVDMVAMAMVVNANTRIPLLQNLPK